VITQKINKYTVNLVRFSCSENFSFLGCFIVDFLLYASYNKILTKKDK